MSQSDYLRRKKVANELSLDASLNPIYDYSKYLTFKQFQFQNEIGSSNINYSNIINQNNKNLFGVERNVTNCPSFAVCSDSVTGGLVRENRVPHVGRMCNDYPLNWYENKVKEEAKNLDCKCELNRTATDANACACVTNRR